MPRALRHGLQGRRRGPPELDLDPQVQTVTASVTVRFALADVPSSTADLADLTRSGALSRATRGAGVGDTQANDVADR